MMGVWNARLLDDSLHKALYQSTHHYKDFGTTRLHWWNFRPSNWRVYWQWAPGTVVQTYQRL